MMGRLSEDFAAWRRGDRRVAPHGARGRIYVKKNGDNNKPPGLVRVGCRPTVRIGLKVMRTDGTVEYIGGVERRKVSWWAYLCMLWNRFVRRKGIGSNNG